MKCSTETNICIEDVYQAAKTIEPYAHRTPVATCKSLDDLAGCEVFLKCENLQKVGAFKFRGACNAVMNLSEEQASRGVVTHSSGNHAQALALAAKLRGIKADIVMPSNSSEVKRAAVKGYGGNVHICEANEKAREELAAELVEKTGGVLINPFDNPFVVSGQGTAALELLSDFNDLDAIITPVGGGGLLSGTCIAAKGLKPDIRVFGAEPTGADDAARSLAAGVFIPQTGPDTICDGLLTSLGKLTWPIIRDNVESIFTVTDEKTIQAMRFFMQRTKLLIEPSAATVIAAILSDEFKELKGINKIGVIISGGNVDLDKLPW